jgi:hypothetical protein
MTRFVNAAQRSREFRLHPLGFFYLQDVVARGSNRRVHVWLPTGPDPAENDRHQHSFDINSRIMVGSMRNELFQFRETSSGTDREFAVGYEQGQSILSTTGRIGRLDLFSAFDSVAGASYCLEAGVIHRVVVTKKPCVTMLTTKERGIRIFSYGQQREELPFARRIVNANEAHQIEKVLGDMTSGEA